mmetsp:Transcript_50423/g.107391  ORF Transcript_50423/g.107391 Transcript_50423/m.107391 type:complete len:258 (-) Transcript_50423:308-1081(-)
MSSRHVLHRPQEPLVRPVLEQLLGDLRTGPRRQVLPVVLPSQESQRQGRVAQHLHVQFPARVEQPVLDRPPVQQRHLDLVRRKLDATFGKPGVTRAERVDAVVAHPDRLHESPVGRVGETVPVLGVGPRVGEVDLVQIDGPPSQSLHACLAGLHHVLPFGPPRQCGELASDDDLFLLLFRRAPLFAELSQELLAPTEPVQFSGVEEGEVLREGVIEHLPEVLVVLPVVSPEDGVSPRPRPESQRGEGEGPIIRRRQR